jgi:hypothetical protein
LRRFSWALTPKPRSSFRRPSSTAARRASEARQPHHRDQPDGDLGAQLDGTRDVPGLVERDELLLERLADVRQLGDLAVAGELHDRDGGVAHRAGGVAIGDDAVLDRAVELVEVRQLLEGGGDLGVGEVGHGVA